MLAKEVKEEPEPKNVEKLMLTGTFMGSEECWLGTPSLLCTQNNELATFYLSVHLHEKYGSLAPDPLADIKYKDPIEHSFCKEGAGVQKIMHHGQYGGSPERMVRPGYLIATPLVLYENSSKITKFFKTSRLPLQHVLTVHP